MHRRDQKYSVISTAHSITFHANSYQTTTVVITNRSVTTMEQIPLPIYKSTLIGKHRVLLEFHNYITYILIYIN